MTDDKPLEGDELRMARCEGCGGLSLVMLKEGKRIAYVCQPNMALLELAGIIVAEIKKSVIHFQ